MTKASSFISFCALVIVAADQASNREAQIQSFQNCLRKTIPNANVMTQGAEYEAANYQWNLRNIATPLAIFSPEDKDQIQTAVQCSISTNVPIVPKCGGHSYEKYSFGIGKEIIVDLHKMDKVTVDAKTQTATVQAGALLGHVYYQLFHQGGYAVPAGSCPTVGVSGHTLGGGYGFSSRKHGFMVDNLLRANIVLPDGNATYASDSNNADLFWALRGAGTGNFGIVTEFKFKIFRPPTTVTRLKFQYTIGQFEEAFKHFQKWAASNPDPSITAVAHINKHGFDVTSVIQPDSETHRSKIISSIAKAFPIPHYNNDTRFDTSFIEMIRDLGELPNASVELLDKVTHDLMPKKFFRAKSAYVDRELNENEIKTWKQVVQDSPEDYLVLFDMQGGALNKLGRTDTAFVHRRKALYSIQLIGDYNPENLVKANEDWAETYFQSLDGMLSNESFQNYIDAKAGNSYQKYYAENFDKLKIIKRKYDPKNRFNFKQSIPLA